MDMREACEAPKVNGRADSILRKPALAQRKLAAGPIPRPYPQLGSQPAMPANLQNNKCTVVLSQSREPTPGSCPKMVPASSQPIISITITIALAINSCEPRALLLLREAFCQACCVMGHSGYPPRKLCPPGPLSIVGGRLLQAIGSSYLPGGLVGCLVPL